MVTPTFAAGLGVVVAAGLAVNMTARTVLHFGPDQKTCAVRNCAVSPSLHGGVGTLASAKPGIRLEPSTLGPSRSAQPHSSSTGGGGSGHDPGAQPVIDYRTTQKSSWGFDGQIMISGIPASSLTTWRLAFDYPGTRIVEVQGARWDPTGQDSGVAEAANSSGSPSASGGTTQNGPDASGASQAPSETSSASAQNSQNSGSGQNPAGNGGQRAAVVITIEASGPPSAPSDCHFNNVPCSFR